MSDVIDWSKAPEGATHYTPNGVGFFAAFWRKYDGKWTDAWIIESHSWPFVHYKNPCGPSHASLAVERPQPTPWSGEGLPPVGTVCEVNDARNDTWTRVDEVLASASLSDRDVAVFRIGDYIAYSPADRFRQIRTPEQIAADERKAAIDEMAMIGCMADSPRSLSEKLYDAGYRKQ
jgi:hypothetical protein